jgi:hypothetical protein
MFKLAQNYLAKYFGYSVCKPELLDVFKLMYLFEYFG